MMTVFFGIAGFVFGIAYLVKAIISAYKKDGEGKKNLKTAIGFFALFIIAAVVYQDDKEEAKQASSDKPVVSQEQHKTEKKEVKEVKKPAKKQLSTTAEAISKIKVGMTVEDFQDVLSKDVNIKPDFIPNDLRLKGRFYKTRDGYIFVSYDGKNVTEVKPFKTLDEGKEYADSKSAELDAKEQAKKEASKPKLTLSKENAIAKAKAYLDYTAFSRKGLIDQLKFDNFSTEDATYAVDHIKVDWNEQALKKGKAYMNYTSFSRNGLIEQLEFDGFTSEQATYAVNKIGL